MKHWDRSQAKAIVERARTRWGHGWMLLSDDGKTEALKAAFGGTVLCLTGTLTITGEALQELWYESLREAGLLDESE
jgi:hypothetical protein